MRVVSFRREGGATGVAEVLPDGDGLAVVRAGSMVEWLAGGGRARVRTDEELSLADGGAALCAPVPEPPSVRDFYSFEGHVAAGWRRRGGDVPAAWYRAPVFYFTNPASVHGPGEPVARPPETAMLDFELEIAAVIGAEGEIAGFTLLNDWSARDIQMEEMTVGLGPHKGKDFATSLGPWLVTPDELPYEDGRLALQASVLVNGREVARSDASAQHFSWEEIVAAAARNTRLRPGDVLGSGTLTGGCLLELGPLDGEGGSRWIEPGDVVALEAPGLGRLETPVVAPAAA